MLTNLPKSIISESVQNEGCDEENERSMRLEKKRENSRLSRMNETEEQHQIRLEKARERTRSSRTNETEEERQNRLKDQGERSRSSRTNETEEDRQIRLERQRERSKNIRLDRRLENQSDRSSNISQIRSATRSSINQTWPAPIARELKANCLQKFLEHMSMPMLAEVNCAVCNVRTSAKDAKTIPISQIPNIHLLKVSGELKNFIKHSIEGDQSTASSNTKTTNHTESNNELDPL